jgi:membrane-associated protease RseP (regulator of RpoE activity)
MGPDDDADDLPPRPPPPRTERPWLHPSELDESAVSTAARTPAMKRPDLWTVITASALVGTVVAVVMVGLVRELGSSGTDAAVTDASVTPERQAPQDEGSDDSVPSDDDSSVTGAGAPALGSTLSTLTQPQPSGATAPWLGIDGMDVDGGVLVTGLTPGGPAATAGMRPGDLIVAAERQAVATLDDLRAMLSRFEPGATFVLDVLREHYRVRLMAVLGVRA